MLSVRALPVNRIHVSPKKNVVIKPKASISEIAVETSYWVGKGIVVYTMFYCTLQWGFYRNLRKRIEDEKEKDD